MSKSTNRYSDQDLAEFKTRIEEKIAKTEQQIKFYEDQIQSISEAQNNESDWMDDTSAGQNLEMLYAMLNRQKKHLQDLKNALVRVHNKSYGICILSGKMIDKRRLLAVPTTTKSVEAKNSAQSQPSTKPSSSPSNFKPKKSGNIISKVVKPKSAAPKVNDPLFDDEDDIPDFDMKQDLEHLEEVDSDDLYDDI